MTDLWLTKLRLILPDRIIEHDAPAIADDRIAADWVGALAASEHAPELIWAEFLLTDTLQHYNGYKSELGHFSVEQADMALGRILQRLCNAGVEEEWNINPDETAPTGKPKAISTHGLKPGWPGDHRFAIFAGPDVLQGSVDVATATQVAPTLAKLLGLGVEEFATAPVF